MYLKEEEEGGEFFISSVISTYLTQQEIRQIKLSVCIYIYIYISQKDKVPF